MMSNFNVTGPGAARSGGYVNSDHIDHLLAFVHPVEVERTGRTEKYVAAQCDFVICTTCTKAWTDADVSGKALAPQLLSGDGEVVSGTLILGEAKPNQNAPILLADPTPDEVAVIQKLFGDFGARLPSGKIIFDIDSYAAF
jgi:hypothetical protein